MTDITDEDLLDITTSIIEGAEYTTTQVRIICKELLRTKERIAKLEKSQEWISPDEFQEELLGKNILLLFDDEAVATGYCGSTDLRFYSDKRKILGGKVVGWQRVPKAPKE